MSSTTPKWTLLEAGGADDRGSQIICPTERQPIAFVPRTKNDPIQMERARLLVEAPEMEAVLRLIVYGTTPQEAFAAIEKATAILNRISGSTQQEGEGL